jgi:hypothetical protein
MERLAKQFLSLGPEPRATPSVPATSSATRFPQNFIAEGRMNLTRHDLNAERTDGSKRQMKNLLQLVINGANRAHKCEPPLILVDRALSIKYSSTCPDQSVAVEDAEPYFWLPASKPILILNRDPGLTTPFNGLYRRIQASLPALHSTPGCSCPDTKMNNNLPYNLYSTVCMPSAMVPPPDFDAAPELQHAVNQQPALLNRSILYAGPVNTAACAEPQISLRQPLANLRRGKEKPYHITGSKHNLLEYGSLAKKLAAEVMKPDSAVFRKHFAESSGNADDKGNLHRFPSVDPATATHDFKLSAQDDMDVLLNNSVLVSPFHGVATCPYCFDTVPMDGIQSLVTHLASKHRILKYSWFSCPVCLNPTVTKWSDYEDHFRRRHHNTSGFLMVLMESNTHSRTAMGIALSAVIAMADCLPTYPRPEEIDEVKQLYGSYGGYFPVENKNPNVLVATIMANQENCLPEGVLHEINERASARLARQQEKEERVKAAPQPDRMSVDDDDVQELFAVVAGRRRHKMPRITAPLRATAQPPSHVNPTFYKATKASNTGEGPSNQSYKTALMAAIVASESEAGPSGECGKQNAKTPQPPAACTRPLDAICDECPDVVKDEFADSPAPSPNTARERTTSEDDPLDPDLLTPSILDEPDEDCNMEG